MQLAWRVSRLSSWARVAVRPGQRGPAGQAAATQREAARCTSTTSGYASVMQRRPEGGLPAGAAAAVRRRGPRAADRVRPDLLAADHGAPPAQPARGRCRAPRARRRQWLRLVDRVARGAGRAHRVRCTASSSSQSWWRGRGSVWPSHAVAVGLDRAGRTQASSAWPSTRRTTASSCRPRPTCCPRRWSTSSTETGRMVVPVAGRLSVLQRRGAEPPLVQRVGYYRFVPLR